MHIIHNYLKFLNSIYLFSVYFISKHQINISSSLFKDVPLFSWEMSENEMKNKNKTDHFSTRKRYCAFHNVNFISGYTIQCHQVQK